MKGAFLAGVTRMKDLPRDEGHVRQQFVRFYAWMVTYFVDQPLDKWNPRFLENAEPEDKRRSAWELGRALDDMDNGRQREWWQRWLGLYWESRLKGELYT